MKPSSLCRRICSGICIAGDISSFVMESSHVSHRSVECWLEREPMPQGKNVQQPVFKLVGGVSPHDPNIWRPATKSFEYSPLREDSSFAEIIDLSEKNVPRLPFNAYGVVASTDEGSFQPAQKSFLLNVVSDVTWPEMSSSNSEKRLDLSVILKKYHINWKTKLSNLLRICPRGPKRTKCCSVSYPF